MNARGFLGFRLLLCLDLRIERKTWRKKKDLKKEERRKKKKD